MLTLPYNSNTRGGFVKKLTAAGSLIWVQPDGAIGATTVNGLALDTAGNAYLVGTFQGSADFNPVSGITETPDSLI